MKQTNANTLRRWSLQFRDGNASVVPDSRSGRKLFPVPQTWFRFCNWCLCTLNFQLVSSDKKRKEKLVLSMGKNTENSTEANSLCFEAGARSHNVEYTGLSSLLLECCYRSCRSSRSTIRTAWTSDLIQRQFMPLRTVHHAEGRWWVSCYWEIVAARRFLWAVADSNRDIYSTSRTLYSPAELIAPDMRSAWRGWCVEKKKDHYGASGNCTDMRAFFFLFLANIPLRKRQIPFVANAL